MWQSEGGYKAGERKRETISLVSVSFVLAITGGKKKAEGERIERTDGMARKE